MTDQWTLEAIEKLLEDRKSFHDYNKWQDANLNFYRYAYAIIRQLVQQVKRADDALFSSQQMMAMLIYKAGGRVEITPHDVTAIQDWSKVKIQLTHDPITHTDLFSIREDQT